jgi:hypothetical protein
LTLQAIDSHPAMAQALFMSVLDLTEAFHQSVAEEDIDKYASNVYFV